MQCQNETYFSQEHSLFSFLLEVTVGLIMLSHQKFDLAKLEINPWFRFHLFVEVEQF